MRYLLDIARARKLDRVTVGYTVAAWAVIQAAALAASAFAWPAWILQTIIVAGVVGLPVVLIAAWTLAVRAEGGKVFAPARADWHVLIALSLLLAVAGTLFVTVFWPRAAGPQVAEQTALASANSIAVLPFANLSGDSGKLYFSEGVSDQLINALSQIPALRVAARTSSFSFQGKNQDVKTIARALDVRSVVEGSVLGVGNRVRIAVELVDGQTGFQIWSRSYDRDLSDILTVQESITREIAGALSSRLLGKSLPVAAVTAQTVDPDSYRLFLQGRFFAARDTEADYRRAVELFKQVTERSPDYADGFAQYSDVLIALASDYGDGAALAPAEEAARHALSLDGHNLMALHTLMVVSITRWDWLAAADSFRRARRINPNSAVVLHSQSVLAATMDFPQQDFDAEKRAADLDPLSFVPHYNLAIWFFQQARYDEAAAAQQNALLLQPSNTAGRDSLCSIQVARGKLAEAHQIMDSLAALYADPQWRIGCPLDLALAEGRKADARKIADEAAAAFSPSDGGATEVGNAYRSVGDVGQAMIWYERAYAARERDLLLVPDDRLQSGALLADARWKALWARQPIQDWLAARREVGVVLGAGQ